MVLGEELTHQNRGHVIDTKKPAQICNILLGLGIECATFDTVFF